MKVTGFYYIDYPDYSPVDRKYAVTELYVQIGEDNAIDSSFTSTYAFQVYTVRYVEENFFSKGIPLFGRAVIVIDAIDEATMSNFLNANVSKLIQWGDNRG